MKPGRFLPVMLVGLAGLFGWGVLRLFHLRFSAGDVYPPYSTLRADPLGAKAWYESLDNLPDFAVRRNYRPIDKLRDQAPVTLFVLGDPVHEVSKVTEQEAVEVEKLITAGHRLVVTILPEVVKPTPRKEKKTEDKAPPAEEKEKTPRRFQPVSLEKRWGFELQYAYAATNALWRTTLYFDHLDPKWTVRGSRGQYPAIIERAFGKGTVVLCADSYLVSNEALRRDRHPELLAQLLGGNRTVVFDETHLGVAEDPGVMTLARQYGLHGLLAGLILLAALYVWQNAVSFVPPYADAAAEPAAGKTSAAGFVNLLRRSIPAARVLTVCVDEWKKSKPHRTVRNLARIDAVVHAQEALPGRQRDPVGSYRTISQLLKERK